MAITTQFLTGFEHGFIGAGANNGGGLFDAAPGSGWSASTSSPRNGSYCAHLVAPANTATRLVKSITGAPTKIVGRVAVKMAASVTCQIFNSTDGAAGTPFDITTDFGQFFMHLGSNGVSGGNFVVGTWHVIEFQIDITAKTLDWKVDGVSKPRVTTAAVAAPIDIGFGTKKTTEVAYTADYDDFIIGTWTNAATDWYGDGKVIAQRPASDGSHNVATSFSPGDAGTAYSGTVTTAYTQVDDPPATGGWTATRSATDNLAMRVATGNAWLEIAPAPSTESVVANAVRAIMSYSSPATQANLAGCEVRNSAGVTTELWGLIGAAGKAYNIVANQFKGGIVATPAAGWTAAEVNAVRLRFGGSTSVDISPVPTVQAMMLEVDWPLVQGTTYNDTRSGTIAVSGSGTELFVGLTPIDETIIDDFNRADGNVAAGAGASLWVNMDPKDATVNDLRVISNRLGSISINQAAYTTTAVEGDDCDILLDCTTVMGPAGVANLYLLITNPATSSFSAYEISLLGSPANVVLLDRHNASVLTELTSASLVIAAGDSLWFSKRGANIKLYRKPSVGSYTQILSFTDPAPLNPTSGVIGIKIGDTTQRWDNLRGGPLAAAGTTYNDSGSGTIVASGSGTEDYSHDASVSGTITASGSGIESYSTPAIYTDSASGTITASGISTDNRIYDDNASGTSTFNGTGVDNCIATDVAVGTITSSGIGTDNRIYDNSASGTITASGSSIESYFNVDSGSGTVTTNGSGVESYNYTDSSSGTVTASGSGVESWTTPTAYDLVIDIDNPTSHWKLGNSSIAVDRKGVRNLPAIGGPISVVNGILANNGSDQANQFVGTVGQSFSAGTGAGLGTPYEGAFTMEAWVTPTADADGVVVKRTVSTDLGFVNSGLGVSVTAEFTFENSANVSFTIFTPLALALKVNQTYHVVGTYDGITAILYINGVEIRRTTSVGVGGVRSSTTVPPLIGSTSASNWPKAVVDEIAWYSGALSPARVIAHYQAGNTGIANFDSGVGTVTVSGSGVRSASYTDSRFGTITSSGSGVESSIQNGSGSVIATVTGSGIESYVSAYATLILADSPVGYWHLNDLTDSSGHGLTLTQTGTVTDVAGIVIGESGAKQFHTDFQNDGLRRADEALVRNGSAFTVEAWVKPADVGGVAFYAVQKDHQYHLQMLPSGAFRLRVFTSSGFFEADSIVTAVAGTTYHIVGVVEDEIVKIYVNGVLEGTASCPGTPSVNTNAFAIGSDPGINQGWWGVVDEVAIYQTVLSPIRIQEHYAVGSGITAVTNNDSGSGTVTASGTGTDALVYSDSGSGTVTASGTGIDSRVYSDTATITISVIGIGIDASAYNDTSTGTIVVSGTGTDARVYPDTGTGTITGTGTGTDSSVYADAGIGMIAVSGTDIEAYVYTDTGIGTIISTGAGTESISYTASAIGTATVNGTSAETASHSASATGAIVISGTGIDSEIYNDARSGTVLISGTGVDSSDILITYIDARSGQITVSGTSIESQSHSSTATGSLSAVGTSIESQSHSSTAIGTVFVDGTSIESQSYSNTATGTVSVNGTSIESQSHTSTAIGTVSISGTSVESQSHSSTAIGSASVNGTSTESQSHTNTATGFVFVDGTGSETYDISSTDTSVGIITSTGTGVESISYSNTAIGTITSTGTSIDTVFYSNTADGTITLLGSGGESSSYTDASTGVIVLIGTGREIGAHTQPIPFSTIIALNRFTVTVRNQASIQSVITNTTPLSVQIALQRSIKVDVAKRNGTKVLVKSR